MGERTCGGKGEEVKVETGRIGEGETERYSECEKRRVWEREKR